MLNKIIISDIKKSKLISTTIFLFIIFSSFLLSTSGIVFSNLFGSIDQLMESAKTPHFLQMHMGDINISRIDDFAKNNESVKDYQVLGFLNIDVSNILVNGDYFTESSQDNGFSYQSEKFDFLLDLDNQIIDVKEGEVYVPLSYFLNKSLEIGDTLKIGDVELEVKGPLRDSQMNSTLSSSKRLLVNKNDYDQLIEYGREEYLIEFLLKDLEKLPSFSGQYVSENLEANGPTLTLPLFKLINAVSDGLMLAVLALISLLILMVSFLCIRFTLLSKVEDEYREIGVLKGIGIRVSEIKKLYMTKYKILSLLGALVGFLLALLLSDKFLEPIKLSMGTSDNGLLGVILGLAGALIIFLLVSLYVSKVLNRFKKISPSEAIRLGRVGDQTPGAKNMKLRKYPVGKRDLFLGLKNVLARKKIYLTFAIILIISSFIMILPMNINSTIQSKKFINYMGLGNSDVLISVQESENLESDSKKILDQIKKDQDVKLYAFFKENRYEVKLENGETSQVWTKLGNHYIFPVKYIEGNGPQTPDEISLSYLMAEDLGKKVGDKVTYIVNDKEVELIITGTYSDITNGGKTAYVTFEDEITDSLMASALVSFKDGVDISEKVEEYKNAFPFAKSIDLMDFKSQVFGSTLDSVNKAAIVALVLGILLSFLITLLFMNMLTIRDRHNISILKSLGFKNREIRGQYFIGSIFLVIVGSLLGGILASTLGQVFAGQLISMFGVANFKFEINPLFVFLIAPGLLALFVYLGTKLGLKNIEKLKISDYIKE